MHFLHGEGASDTVAGDASFLAIHRSHRIYVSLCLLFIVAADARARDRLDRFDAAIGLRNQSWQQAWR